MKATLNPRIQMITPAGGAFRFEAGVWAPSAATPPKAGDIVEIKTVVAHAMESGYRKDKSGAVFPRNIINLFTAMYAGEEVFRAELGPGVSANPYIAFFMRVSGPGDLVLVWRDDAGRETTESIPLPLAPLT